MGTGSRPPVPIALASGGTPTEEGRAFCQSRLALFGGWVFVISGGFYAAWAIVTVVYGTGSRPGWDRGTFFHLAGTLIAGSIWAIGRSVRLSWAAVRGLDAVGTLLLCASFALMAGGFAVAQRDLGVDPTQAILTGVFACSYVLISRAIAVPSTPGRTTWISAAAIVPLLGTNAFVFPGPDVGSSLALINVILWTTAAVAMAAIASRVIFGLRAEVSKIRHLGQYTLEQKIGEGGMGIVYRAHHALLRRPTAIKLLPPDRAGEENIRRFEREVQLTARLSHPSTVAIFDFGRTPEGVFYYAMEYLDGIDLERLVREDGPQPPARVVYILQQVSGALAEAHGIGLIHRDVKPANIILCERGGAPDVAKVVDFGLVKRLHTGGSELTMSVTAANVLVGTPAYVAPEAVSGEWNIDGRSDLYAVGAVGYYLLTGTTVFTASTMVEVFAHHLHTEPQAPSARAGVPVPADLERVILQCLAKSPRDRPRDARTLERALAGCAKHTVWSLDEAARWWVAFRRSHPAAAESAVSPSISETAVVDLADRVSPWR